MKILNLYAGIGGNRKLWGDEHEITAVELNPSIAAIYQDFFPNDTVIVADAHQYLLDHYKEYDFIWSSPPCPTHSDIRRMAAVQGQYGAMYPDFKLWQEVTLLKHFSKCRYAVENVRPYYDPIIVPNVEIDRHCFWSNFHIPVIETSKREVVHQHIGGSETIFGFNVNEYKIPNKRQVLRNMVNPELGLHILNTAIGAIPPIQEGLFAQ
jgi:DNA (cytosine-5)-methyltransferase 1